MSSVWLCPRKSHLQKCKSMARRSAPSCINNDVITRHLIIERESYVSARVAEIFYTLFMSMVVYRIVTLQRKFRCVAFFSQNYHRTHTHIHAVKYGALCSERFLDLLINPPAVGQKVSARSRGVPYRPAPLFFPAALPQSSSYKPVNTLIELRHYCQTALVFAAFVWVPN